MICDLWGFAIGLSRGSTCTHDGEDAAEANNVWNLMLALLHFYVVFLYLRKNHSYKFYYTHFHQTKAPFISGVESLLPVRRIGPFSYKYHMCVPVLPSINQPTNRSPSLQNTRSRITGFSGIYVADPIIPGYPTHPDPSLSPHRKPALFSSSLSGGRQPVHTNNCGPLFLLVSSFLNEMNG